MKTIPASALLPEQAYLFAFGSTRHIRHAVRVRPAVLNVAGIELSVTEVLHRTPSGELATVNFTAGAIVEIYS